MKIDNEKSNILIVDDDKESIRILAKLLEQDYSPMVATNADDAYEIACSAERPELILLDVVMPDINGFDLCARLKQDAQTREIPVIFITGMDSADDETKGFAVGAVDYITKPFNPPIVEARVRTHLELEQHRNHLDALIKKRTVELEREILHHKQTEGVLRANESKLSSIVDAFKGFIYTVGTETPYQIDYMNQPFIDHVGDDGTGKPCYQVMGYEAPCPSCELEKVYNGEIVEMELENPENNKWYHVIHSPIFERDRQVKRRQAILIDITKRKIEEKALKEQEAYLRKENTRLRSTLKDRYRFGSIIGKSMPMQAVYEAILKAAGTDAGVIIYGESGTGKELVSRAIHEQSERRRRKLVSVNCAAIPDHLTESEFFGYKKGAFTGADRDKQGYLKLADGGTLFLDEIGDIKMDIQAKLLRAIEGGGFSPVGGREVLHSDCRIVAATSKDLKSLIQKGLIREDFYFRIHIIPIHLPALRERTEDIPHLVEHFMKLFDPENRLPVTGKMMDALQYYDWPGNVRELQNVLQRYVTMGAFDLAVPDAPHSPEGEMDNLVSGWSDQSLSDVLSTVEKKLILEALNKNRWQRDRTAKELQLHPKTLYRRMKQFNLAS